MSEDKELEVDVEELKLNVPDPPDDVHGEMLIPIITYRRLIQKATILEMLLWIEPHLLSSDFEKIMDMIRDMRLR